jgi:hypothetical protein
MENDTPRLIDIAHDGYDAVHSGHYLHVSCYKYIVYTILVVCIYMKLYAPQA